MKALHTTDNSWIIKDENQCYGILSLCNEEYQYFLKSEMKTFETWHDIEIYFNTLEIEERKNDVIEKNINGYPIKHQEIYNIEKDDNPSYTTKEHTYVRYYAGYWIVEKGDGFYTMYLSPKTTTVRDKNGKGPYKERIECMSEINIMNSMVNKEKDE